MRVSASWTAIPSAGLLGVRCRRFVTYVLLFLGAVAGIAEAQPTQLTVRVLQPNGNPVSLATVCIAAQGGQAGSRLSDPQGVAVLAGLPAGTYNLHVIRSNFQTTSQSVNLSGTQERTVTLQPGASTAPAGVNCQAGGAPTTLPPIKITSFEVQDLPADFKLTSPPVTHLPLRATFDRQPAFFRIVEDSGYAYTTPLQNLRTASWVPFQAPNVQPFVLFPLNLTRPYGTRVIHLQVNSQASEEGASQIKSVSVVLTPGQFRTSVLTGASLQAFLDRAQQEGYGPLKPKGFRTYPEGFRTSPDLSVCPAGGLPVLIDAGTVSLACNSDLDCPVRLTCQAGVCSGPGRLNFYLPAVGWFTAQEVQATPVDGQLAQARPRSLVERAEFHAFAGPPLMPFWRITDLRVLHDWLPQQPEVSGGWPGWFQAPPPAATISVGGYNMVNNPLQPPIQDPDRIIAVERTIQFPYRMKPVCIAGTEPPSPPLPRFLSVTVVGPEGRDPLEAFPPRGLTAGGRFTLPPFRFPPGTLGPFPSGP